MIEIGVATLLHSNPITFYVNRTPWSYTVQQPWAKTEQPSANLMLGVNA